MRTAGNNAIRVLIADDHEMVREALSMVLALTPDIEVVGTTGRAAELTAALTYTPCDVLLLDLKLDRWVINDIPELAKTTALIILSGSDEQDIIAAFHKGAHGIVPKMSAVETLEHAIRAVAAGRIWVPPAMRARVSVRCARFTEQLTAREAEIAKYVALGLRNAEVAEKLSITEGTVKVRLNRIFSKLNVRDRVELALYAVRIRLIEPSENAGSFRS